MHRYFLALLFEDATKDHSIPFGPDSGAATEMLADLTQNGGPDGICRAILYSTRRRCLVRTLYPASTLQLDAATIQAATETRNAAELGRKRAELTSRLALLKREAGDLDMSDILLHGDEEGEGDTATVSATPWQDLSIDERRQRLIEEATALGLTVTPEASQDADKPVQPATGSQDAPAAPATASSTQPGAKKAQGAPGAKKAAQDVAKPSEGAADSDSASDGPGTSGDLLGG